MLFNRKSSPLPDPYTTLPRAPNSKSRTTHSRSASASFAPENPSRAASKRHTYHALQALPPASPATSRNRFASLPSGQEAFARGRPLHPSIKTLQNKIHTAHLDQGPNQPPPSHPRRLKNSDPRALLRRLNALLDPKSQRIPDFLDVDHLMALHERDLMDREQRDAIKVQARLDRLQGSRVTNGQTVFGTSLREATMHASNETVLGGYGHDVPIVVFRCVQELCRHASHNPIPQGPSDLDRARLLALVSDFDSEPYFGSKTHLNCPSELREIYALLTTYLFALPEPILSSEMFEAAWAWCVLPSLRSTDFLENDNRSRRHVPPDAGIHIAQLLLQLLPLPNFSLLVYMMGFFQRLPHMGTEDVARAVFVGNATQAIDGRAERASMMMRWFLDHWDAIFRALFPLRPQVNVTIPADHTRKSRTPSHGSPGDFLGNSPALSDAGATPRIVHVDPPNGNHPLVRLPSDGLFETALGMESDRSSISSSVALGERLLDVTAEFALDARLDENRWDHVASDNASVDSGYQSPEEEHHPELPSPHPPEEHSQVVRRISALERELERSDVAVSEAISETFKARERVAELEDRLRGYEKEAAKRPPVLELELDKRAIDDWHAVVQSDTEALKVQLAVVTKERDEALQIVEDIRKAMRTRGWSL
ncbi:hypothetical protein C8J57DRAFT_1722826 [Mycena rebaudengoi]|nr:hypothetical protein C8J57DRAFT_1722826 [Mycena rebaudengoi]